MAQALNQVARDHGAPYVFHYTTMSRRAYHWHVSIDEYLHECDYISKSDKMRVLFVEYPPEYYAVDVPITTSDLVNLYRNGDTFDTFAARVLSEYEI